LEKGFSGFRELIILGFFCCIFVGNFLVLVLVFSRLIPIWLRFLLLLLLFF
jgi:hypothetical protein